MKSLNVLACCILGFAAGWSPAAAAADAKTEVQTKQATANPTLTIVNIASHCDWSWGHNPGTIVNSGFGCELKGAELP